MKTYDSATTLRQENRTHLPLQERFLSAGSIWKVSTNSQEILDAMQESFLPAYDKHPFADLTVSFYVDFELPDRPLWPQPHFRALEHLYYASYGPCDSLLIDQLNRRVIGSFTSATAHDLAYWKRVILPVLVGIASASVGVAPLHCACLVKNGDGLLLSGESGAGKSTLALSLALNGFSFLSDDCTYLSRSASELRCWGLPTPVKLLPDAVHHFPRLLGFEPGVSLNGELSFEVDPVETFSVGRSLSCVPRWLVFLQRQAGLGTRFERISASEAAARLAADLEQLPACIAYQREYQLASIDALAQQEAWVLRHDLPPSGTTKVIEEFCGSQAQAEYSVADQVFTGSAKQVPLVDPIKRFTPTPFATTFDLNADARIRVETNSETLGEQLRGVISLFDGCAEAGEFVLRVVVESDDDLVSDSRLGFRDFNHTGLAYFLAGQKSFVAWDRQNQRGVCFVACNIIKDTHLLRQFFLPALTWMFSVQDKE